jgi:hypothetical protein
VKNCNALDKVTTVSYVFAIPPTAFLFCLRVWAVHPGNRLVMVIFGLLWLAVLGTSFLVPIMVAESVHIGTTGQCINSKVSPLAGAPVVVNMVLNLLVFVVVSWRLAAIKQSNRSRFWAMFKGEGMSPLASMVIKSGQLYYLCAAVRYRSFYPWLTRVVSVSLSFNIVVFIVFIAPGVSPVIRVLLSLPHMALENSMATRVFRMLKFDTTSSALDMSPNAGSRRPGTYATRSQEESQRGHNMLVFRNKTDSGVEVEVSTHIHASEDDGFVSMKAPELSV